MTGTELLTWYRANRRRLPWRTDPRDPYRVLVSETMLQQTQVDRVVPRFEQFVERFPSLAALASADEEEVVAAWSGLGYYRRARALHQLAKRVVAAGGELPTTPEELVELPGVGSYTAAAVASIAFGVAEPVLDGNVLRVGARVLAVDGDPRAAKARSRILMWVRDVMRHYPPGEINEALMELGAMVCRPLGPSCPACPMTSGCQARVQGRQEELPPPRKRRRTEDHRWVAACVEDENGRWLLRRVVSGPILAGLWLPPWADWSGVEPCAAALELVPLAAQQAPSLRVCPSVHHAITHRRIEIVPVHVVVHAGMIGFLDPGQWRWGCATLPGMPTSSLLAKLRRAVDDPSRMLPFADGSR